MALSKERALERLNAARNAGRLAHACLFSGPSGSGKKWLATELAAHILNTTASQVATHPDFHAVSPESKSRRIVTDQIRELEHTIQMKPLLGPSKVAILHDADRLQPQAANAFLKTLEEPPPGCHILLTTTLRDAVMTTILSRCITVPLTAPQNVARDEHTAAISTEFEKALLQHGEPDAGCALRFTRFFQSQIASIRENVRDTLEDELKEQVKRHRDSLDKNWRETREEQIKAQSESHVVRERERYLAAIGEVLSAALRHHLQPSPTPSETICRIAAANDARLLLKRLDALERTRKMLSAGVQEALALESGFLQIISTP
jgi:DNA polymerase-3 subunit delta'